MDHHHDPATGSSTVDVLALLLRLALLLSTAFLAGGGLLRPLVTELPRRQKLVLYSLGGLSALLAVVSEFAVDVNVGVTDPIFATNLAGFRVRIGTSTAPPGRIVSNTPSHTMRMLWSMDKAAMTDRHILFQEEDKDTYIRDMLFRALSNSAPMTEQQATLPGTAAASLAVP